MKLISMTDFVLKQLETKQSTSEFKEVVRNYANFLKRPLTSGIFVPCDLDDNILEDVGLIPSHELEQYRKAKERVLFQFDYLMTTERAKELISAYSTIEEYGQNYEPELTESAIKQIGL